MAAAIFSDLSDSPLFRQRAAELGSASEALQSRTKKLVAGGHHYSDGLEAQFQSTLHFAQVLQDFCGGADEESAGIGGPTMMRFVHCLREVASFIELLRTQVQLLVCGRLGEAAAAEATEVREARRRLAQCTADYDAARARHLGHARRGSWPTTKAAAPEQAQRDMEAARAAAEAARHDLVRTLVAAQGRQSFIYLESMASVMQAHLKYFQHGASTMQSLQAYIDETLSLSERRKAAAAAQQAALEEVMSSVRQARDAAANSNGGAEALPMGAADVEPAPEASPRETPSAGPLQMTAATTQLAAELGAHIRATRASGGSLVTCLKQGYLLKQSSRIKSKWQRRFFVLDSSGTLYYFSAKGERKALSDVGRRGGSSLGAAPTLQPTMCCLLTSTVKPGPPPESPAMRFAFRLVSPEREYVLQAEDAAEAQGWMDVLQSTIACLLAGIITTEHAATPPWRSPQGASSADWSISLLPHAGPLAMGAAAAAAAASPGASDRSTSASSPSPLGMSALPGGHLSSPTSPAERTAPGVLCDASAAPPTVGVAQPVGRSQPAPAPLQVLRDGAAVGGNSLCADCGESNPEWGSLNLGTLQCIECSGFHRQLGVHTSKVRSLTLDVRVWEPPVVALFQALGNTFANEVWEGGLSYTPRASASASAGYLWENGSEDDSSPLSSAIRRLSAGNVLPLQKPGPLAPSAAKEQYVRAKYAERRFVRPPEDDSGQPVPEAQMAQMAWEAVTSHDVRAAYYALACGVDAARAYDSSPAAQLVWEANLQAGGTEEHPLSPSSLGEVGLLHAAARSGHAVLLELLLQWGANADARDVCGRTPLMYALLYDQPEVAKQLLRRSAAGSVRDRTGRTAAQLAMGRRCGGDSELALMLTRAV